MKLIITLFLFILTSCQFWHKQQQELYVPLKNEIKTIDPHQSYDYNSNLVTGQIYDSLYQFHFLKRPYTPEPLIAQDFPEVLSGGLAFKIKIKQNIFYHAHPLLALNSTVKASDFVNSFKRHAYEGTKSRSWWLIKNLILGVDELHERVKTLKELMDYKLEGVQALSDDELLIKVTKPTPMHQLLNILSMPFTAPIPSEVFSKMNNDLDKQEVGTGAYELVSIDKDKEITLKAFPKYATASFPNVGDRYSHDMNFFIDANKKLPFIPSIIFKVIPEELDRWALFSEQKLDLIELPREKFLETIQDDGTLKDELQKKGIRLEQSPSLAFFFLEFNMNDPVLGKNKLLRKALVHAINVDEYLQKFSHNADQKANSLFGPGIFGYSPSKELPYKYNLELAKKYFAEAGYGPGKKQLTLNFETRRDTKIYIEQAQFIKDSLKKLDINVTIVINSFSTFLDKAANHQMQWWQGGWIMDFADAENTLQLFYSPNTAIGGPNKSQFHNVKFDQLFEKLVQLPNNAEKLETLETMEGIIHEELPMMMLYYSKNYFLYREPLKNFRFNELSMGFFKYLRFE